MKIKFQAAAILAVAVISTAAFAVQGLSLKRTVKEGQTHKYKMSGAANVQGLDITISGTVVEKVLKVEENGNYVIQQDNLDTQAEVMGQVQEIPSEGPTTMTYNSKGEIVSIEGAGEGPEVRRLSNLSAFVHDGSDVKVGQKWKHELKADAEKGIVPVSYDYEIVGEEKVGSVDTIKIKMAAKETEGSAPAESTGTVWLDKATGWIVKSESELKNAPIQGMSLDMKINLTRVE